MTSNVSLKTTTMVMMMVILMTTMVSLSAAQGGGPPLPGHGYPQVESSHCRYLVNAPSPWGVNASPFKLYTRSYAGEVRRGYPIEVSILPLYERFKQFNFSDFAVWAEPVHMGPPPGPHGVNMGLEGGASIPPPSTNTVTHVGVWQVYPQYAGGASSMRCNTYSRGEDTVGTFESRMLELLKAQFPGDGRLLGLSPIARHGVAFLWYPDENALNSGAIKFVAKLKSFTQWFHLESTAWKVYQPPPPRQPFNGGMNINTFLEQYSDMNQQAIAMERKMEQAGNGAL